MRSTLATLTKQTIGLVRRCTSSGPHKDPFDYMLVGQTKADSVPIVSNKALFDAYGVPPPLVRAVRGNCRLGMSDVILSTGARL